MANEIKYEGSLSFAKGVESARLSGSGRADMAGTHYIQTVQTVGTDEEAIGKGDIGTVGWCAFRNTDPDNFVEVGRTTGVYDIKVLPGKFSGPVYWNGTTVFAKANTGAVDVEYLLLEA